MTTNLVIPHRPLGLPQPVAQAVEPVFAARPIAEAMPDLVIQSPLSPAMIHRVAQAVEEPAIAERPLLVAALWLYVDDLERSHRVSQTIDTVTGAFWHGIMHRREGDFSNSHYWFRRVGHHPAFTLITHNYEPHAFIAGVDSARYAGKTPPRLIDLQRREWVGLFRWCAAQRTLFSGRSHRR